MIIREARDADLEVLTTIYNHYVVNTHVTFDLQPFDVAERRAWLDKYNQNDIHRLLVGEFAGEVVGYASSSEFRSKPAYQRSVETTIYLDPAAQGHGYGLKLYQALIDSLDPAEVHRCYGVIALPNDASVALHRKLGFIDAGRLTEVGYKFDKYWDTLWMEKTL